MLKLFHVLDLPKSGIVVMQLFVCGCVSYPRSAMLCHVMHILVELSTDNNMRSVQKSHIFSRHRIPLYVISTAYCRNKRYLILKINLDSPTDHKPYRS
jgi:hypothetical protein